MVGISTLEIGAAQHQLWPGPVCSLIEAGRAELYAGCYVFERVEHKGIVTYSPRLLADYQVLPPQGLVQYLQAEVTPLLSEAGGTATTPYLFCGEISESSRLELTAHLAEQALFAPVLPSVRRATTLAGLAWQRLAAQTLDDPLTLEPLYLRRPHITTSTRKQPLLGKQSLSANQPTIN